MAESAATVLECFRRTEQVLRTWMADGAPLGEPATHALGVVDTMVATWRALEPPGDGGRYRKGGDPGLLAERLHAYVGAPSRQRDSGRLLAAKVLHWMEPEALNLRMWP